ncbi:MAG: hypothetical protein JJU20_12185 [Opitutales bacterium]|nr:hypothetical protein [Opitutales bacterium]
MMRIFARFAVLAVILLLPQLAQAVMDRTVITSETVEMQGTESRNYFYFRNSVVVEGINLELRCDELTVVSTRRPGGDDGETVGEIGSIESIVAVGNVEIYQAGRSAFAGRAEVNPAEGTVTLKENPRIVDRDVEVQGYQFVLNQGERRFQSIPDPNAPADRPSRSVVRLGALPDLGFDQDEETIELGSPVLEAENGEDAENE